mmetsp:Transcript_103404/g.198526  ORF Transcript_103404/g.198526 Transcript_103404/m.198526 type:complete len:437 (-) Transcript_103404:280-1590(-)
MLVLPSLEARSHGLSDRCLELLELAAELRAAHDASRFDLPLLGCQAHPGILQQKRLHPHSLALGDGGADLVHGASAHGLSQPLFANHESCVVQFRGLEPLCFSFSNCSSQSLDVPLGHSSFQLRLRCFGQLFSQSLLSTMELVRLQTCHLSFAGGRPQLSNIAALLSRTQTFTGGHLALLLLQDKPSFVQLSAAQRRQARPSGLGDESLQVFDLPASCCLFEACADHRFLLLLPEHLLGIPNLDAPHHHFLAMRDCCAKLVNLATLLSVLEGLLCISAFRLFCEHCAGRLQFRPWQLDRLCAYKGLLNSFDLALLHRLFKSTPCQIFHCLFQGSLRRPQLRRLQSCLVALLQSCLQQVNAEAFLCLFQTLPGIRFPLLHFQDLLDACRLGVLEPSTRSIFKRTLQLENPPTLLGGCEAISSILLPLFVHQGSMCVC